MIVKETRIKTGSGHKALAAHVLRGEKNEAILVLAGSEYWLKDWVKEAKREGLTYGLRHIAFNPEQTMTDAELSAFADRLCEELGADKASRTLILHQKDGNRHGHLILPEWQHNHVLSSRFSYMRLEKVARLEEIRLGHPLTAGRHDAAITTALHKEGKHREAALVEALIPEGAPLPRAAYTSQARRITERQAVDLPALKKAITALWQQSGEKLPAFRRLLQEQGLVMREGDKSATRPGAHIIETADGTLIGSFTRLTKTRMKDFHALLMQEALPAEEPRLVCPVSARARRLSPLSARPPRVLPAEAMIIPLRREPSYRPTVTSLTQTQNLNPGFAHYLRDWKKEVARCEHIIRQNPLSLYGPVPTRDQVFQNILREIKPLQIKLKKAKETIDLAHQEREAAYASLLGGLTGRRHKADEAFEKALLSLAEILRYLIETLLCLFGLRETPPQPLTLPVPTARERDLENYYDQKRQYVSALLSKERTLALLRTLYQKSMVQRKEEQSKTETAYRPTFEAAQNRLGHLRQLPGLHKDLDKVTRKAFFHAQHTGQLEQALMILQADHSKTAELQNEFFKPETEATTRQKPAPNPQTNRLPSVTPSPF
ncbi:relaxase/mobilization nuclease domain-containing protein [Acetobacter sp. AAB5]|uniref:relaxase/mobilization nuclease domain-containing protein n=1 Tax=Acetobacter sp. AAB5 TaxID=3418370 RepID=UPI003CF0C7AD